MGPAFRLLWWQQVVASTRPGEQPLPEPGIGRTTTVSREGVATGELEATETLLRAQQRVDFHCRGVSSPFGCHSLIDTQSRGVRRAVRVVVVACDFEDRARRDQREDVRVGRAVGSSRRPPLHQAAATDSGNPDALVEGHRPQGGIRSERVPDHPDARRANALVLTEEVGAAITSNPGFQRMESQEPPGAAQQARCRW